MTQISNLPHKRSPKNNPQRAPEVFGDSILFCVRVCDFWRHSEPKKQAGMRAKVGKGRPNNSPGYLLFDTTKRPCWARCGRQAIRPKVRRGARHNDGGWRRPYESKPPPLRLTPIRVASRQRRTRIARPQGLSAPFRGARVYVTSSTWLPRHLLLCC